MSKTIQQTDDTIDLKELFFSLIAQWKLILICIILSLVCAILYLRVTPEVYSVDAMVQVNDKKGGAGAALLGSELAGVMNSSGLGGMQPSQAEMEILRSRMVLGKTIQDLHLDIQVKPANVGIIDKISHKISFDTNYSKNGISVLQDNDFFEIRQFHAPKEYLDRPLTLAFSNQSYTITDDKSGQVVYTGKLNQNAVFGRWQTAIYAKKVPAGQYSVIQNALPTAITIFGQKYSVAERGKQSGVIGLSLQGTDKQHIASVLNYILDIYKQQNLIQSSAEKEQTLKFLEQRLPELKSDLDASEREFNRFREQYNTVDVTKESDLYLKQSIELETQKIQLEQKQAELAAQYTSEHPMMQEINAQLSAITNKIENLNGTIKKMPEVQRQYLQYYRDVQVKSELYTNLLTTYQTMSIAKAGEIGNVRVVDYAIEPVEPIKPKKLIILVLSLLVGGFIGVLLALVRNLMRTGVRSAEEIEAELDLPVYGTIPKSAYQPEKTSKRSTLPVLAITHSDDVAIESLRSVRTALQFGSMEAKNNVISITSAAPNAGKSFISVNLAAVFAQTGSKVLVIDADLRRGYLHKYFKNDNSRGLSELLLNHLPTSQVIFDTEQANLYYMPRGASPSNSAELLNSRTFSEMLKELQAQFDYIILDTPPVLAVTDSLILAQQVGMNVVVARYGDTPLKELEIVKSRFENIQVPINGIILNGIDLKHGGYGYGYGYNYNYNYSSDKK